MDARTFFYRLGKLIYGIDGAYEEYGRNFKVGTSNLLWILYALNDGAGHSQKRICEDWSIPRSTANTIIKDLESKNYVKLCPIKGERRELLVSLTEKGKEYADGVLSDLYCRENGVYGEIRDPEAILSALTDLTAKIQNIAVKNKKE